MNDNEYANFGLPGDPPSQPVQSGQPAAATVRRGWFFRNLWWMLPAAFLVALLPCGCCGGFFYWLIGTLKSSEPYQMALHRVQTAPEVIEELGLPIEEAGWMPSGNFSYHTNNGVASGKADFDFSVRGPKGTAHVHAEARCRDGKWRFIRLRVTPASTGSTIALPANEKPGKAEEEDDGAGT
jgi:hypothetical protein